MIDLSLVEAGTSVVESATDSSFSADAYPGYFALAIDNAAILNSATLTARLTFTAVGATSEVSVAPIELLVDMPLEVGCFEVVDDPSGGLGGSSVVQVSLVNWVPRSGLNSLSYTSQSCASFAAPMWFGGSLSLSRTSHGRRDVYRSTVVQVIW